MSDGLSVTNDLLRIMSSTHYQLSEQYLPVGIRSSTARNYASSLSGLMEYMKECSVFLPSSTLLRQWRSEMANGIVRGKSGNTYTTRTINAKLSAARRWLRAIAQETTDLTTKIVFKDWADIEDLKETVVQDRVEESFGIRLALSSVEALFMRMSPPKNLKVMRDRAMMGLGIGAGLRVSEVAKLRMKDVFDSKNSQGVNGIFIRQGKGNKSRVVVIGDKESWVFKFVKEYANFIGLTLDQNSEDFIFRGVRPVGSRIDQQYVSSGKGLTKERVMMITEGYEVLHKGEMITVCFHDFRRTYAKLCEKGGMKTRSIMENLGHASELTTERYIGRDDENDWDDRVLNWSLEIP